MHNSICTVAHCILFTAYFVSLFLLLGAPLRRMGGAIANDCLIDCTVQLRALCYLACCSFVFSERELTFTISMHVHDDVHHVHVRYMLSPVRLSSVTLMRATQAVHIFGNISTAFGTLAIR